MNKKFLLCLTFMMLCICSYAQKADIGGISYSVKKGEAVVERIDATLEDALIPERVEIKGKSYPVTVIRKGLFTGRTSPVAYLTSFGYAYMAVKAATRSSKMAKVMLRTLSIPNSVKKIETKAFSGCSYLYSIKLPDTPIRIAANAFDGCNMITEVTCQNGSYPKYALIAIPEKCSFMIAQGNSRPAANQQSEALAQTPTQQTAPAPTAIMKSDVDVNIPNTGVMNENVFAVVFANENYRRETSVKFAQNDGETFAKYCQQVMGLPASNIHTVKDATLNDIMAEVDWLQKVAKAYGSDARVVFYYAGHGIPDEASGTAYLLPCDGIGTNVNTAYSLKKLYEQLGALPVRDITVFLDACFSGAQRGEGMLASARGVAIKAKPQAPQGKMVVFSAATGDETAYPYEEKGHGMFTYFLLKKMQETKGAASYGELGDYVSQQVSRRSIVDNGKSQTPTVVPSAGISESWKTLKLK